MSAPETRIRYLGVETTFKIHRLGDLLELFDFLRDGQPKHAYTLPEEDAMRLIYATQKTMALDVRRPHHRNTVDAIVLDNGNMLLTYMPEMDFRFPNDTRIAYLALVKQE